MTTEYGPGLGAHPPATGDHPPPEVAAAAERHQLGPHIAGRKLANPLAEAGLGVVAAAASFGLLILFSQLGQSASGLLYVAVRVTALFFCFGVVIALVYSLRALARGAQSFHVYAGGFVHRHNRKVRAVTWGEVAELRPVIATRGDHAGKIQHYQLAPHQGTPVAVPLNIRDGRDEFMDQLMAVLRERGIAVR